MAPRTGRKTRPASTPEGRENQLISLAYDLAEKQLRDGTASSQVTTQLLRYGSQRERLEREQIQQQNLLLSAKVDQITGAQRMEDLYKEAMAAFSTYRGDPQPEQYEDDGYYDGR